MATPVLDEPGFAQLGTGGMAPPPPALSHGGGGGDKTPMLFDPTRFGLWAFLGTISMLFIGFTSAYMLRRASADWSPISAPRILWLNTAVLAGSSLTLELARRRLRSRDLAGTARFVGATGLLGVSFVTGQFLAWRALRAEGVFLATNPHSSFFYMLTGIHVLHLSGGLVWFAVIATRLRRFAIGRGSDELGLFATYWHFLGLLWAYLLFVLFVL